MKTIPDLKLKRAKLLAEATHKDTKPAQTKRLIKQMEVVDECIKYLETKPSEDFVNKEFERVKKTIELRMSGFNEQDPKLTRMSPRDVTKMRNEYKKMYDIPKLKQQLSALELLTK
jgi:cobalamin biosynthesis protein CbiD